MRIDITGRSRVASHPGALLANRGGRTIGPGSGSSGGLSYSWIDFEPLIGAGATAVDVGTTGISHGRYRLWSNGEVDVITWRTVFAGTGIEVGSGDKFAWQMPQLGDGSWIIATSDAVGAQELAGKGDVLIDGWHGTALVTSDDEPMEQPIEPFYDAFAIPSWYEVTASATPAMSIWGEGDEVHVKTWWSSDWPEFGGDGWTTDGRAVHAAMYGRFTRITID